MSRKSALLTAVVTLCSSARFVAQFDLGDWTLAKIGDPPAVATGATFDGECFQVTGEAAGSESEQAVFIYQTVGPNAGISARVQRVAPSTRHPTKQVGVMIRESLQPGSQLAASGVRSFLPWEHFVRVRMGESGSLSRGDRVTLPDAWVRLERHGNLFITLRLPDARGWIEHERYVFDAGFSDLALAGWYFTGNELVTAGVCDVTLVDSTDLLPRAEFSVNPSRVQDFLRTPFCCRNIHRRDGLRRCRGGAT